MNLIKFDPLEVSGITAKWSFEQKIFPTVEKDIFNKYYSFKHQNN